MTNHALGAALGLEIFHPGEVRDVTDGFCGDLLSHVMSHLPRDAALITVMNNVNVAAVALLCDAACILLAQGIRPDAQLLERARREDLCLMGSGEDAYRLAVRLHGLLETPAPEGGEGLAC